MLVMLIGVALGVAIVRYARARIAARGEWIAPWDY